MIPQPKNAEVFIGIVARMGVDLKLVSETIQNVLQSYEYDVSEIKTTSSLAELRNIGELSDTTVVEKYNTYIDTCNHLKRNTGYADVLARFAVSQIKGLRPDGQALARNAYIVNQLKRKEESELLRSLYGEHYVQISIHADRSQREQQFAERIADDHPEKPRAEDWAIKAQELLDRDEAEDDDAYGQRVRDVFPLSDVFVDASSPDRLREDLDRFFRALFGDPRVTPTRAEYGMQLANTAALRSSDLSRQVGAAILNDAAEVQALGCNEVPKSGGGTYWTGDKPDGREYVLGKDSNDERKRELLLDIASRMAEAGLLADDYKDNMPALRQALLHRNDDKIKNSQLMDSLEYGRTVHAEMNAITDAARNGHAIRNCAMFVNTFPCHNCAKHIVASGVSVVHYLRPYPKSYARQLFRDSIEIDPSHDATGKVVFRQFIGICGPIYERLFTKALKWKGHDGTVPPFDKKEASFVRRTPLPAYLEAEGHLEIDLRERLESLELVEPVVAD
jgi:deoxycytidylate deaminase